MIRLVAVTAPATASPSGHPIKLVMHKLATLD